MKPAAEPVATVDPKHPTGKLGQVLDAVADRKGASLTEIVQLTGWQAHTARAALCRLRQRGFPIGLHVGDGRRAYKLPGAAPQ